MKSNDLVKEGELARALFMTGVTDALPVILGAAPFGIACGMMGAAIGLLPLENLLMSGLVFAGAAQFTALTMLSTGVSAGGIIILTTLLINLRHLLMGFSLAPHMLHLPKGLQGLLGFLLTDEAYGVVMSRIMEKEYSSAHHLGVSVAIYGSWLIAALVGVFLGGTLINPLEWGLDFAMYATFMVLLMPMLAEKSNRVVCLVAIPISLVSAKLLPGKWYMIVTCLIACVVGGLWKGEENDEN